MKKIAEITSKILAGLIIGSLAYGVIILTTRQHKKPFNPTFYTEQQIFDADKKCFDKFFDEKVVNPMLQKACQDLERMPIEECNFSGVEMNVLKWNWLRTCEQEELEKLGSV